MGAEQIRVGSKIEAIEKFSKLEGGLGIFRNGGEMGFVSKNGGKGKRVGNFTPRTE